MKPKIQWLSIAVLALVFLGMAAFTPRQAPTDTIVVTTPTDELDGSPGNGYCSLREAVANANNDNTDQADCGTGSGADIITLLPWLFTLSLTGDPYDDANLSGDLDIWGELTISGTNAATTIIQAGNSSPVNVPCADCYDRVFHVLLGADVTLNKLTIRHGKALDGTASQSGKNGGGIYNRGDLTLNSCLVTENRAGDGWDNPTGNGGVGGNGGGILTSGNLTVSNSLITNNRAGHGGDGSLGGWGILGGYGGGIYAGADTVVTLTSTIVGNNEAGDGGRGGDMADYDAGFGGNGGKGGGILCGNCVLTLLNSSLLSNESGTGGDGGDVTSGTWNGGAAGSGGEGGGLLLDGSDGSASLIASRVSNNLAGLGGAGGSGNGGGSPGIPGTRGSGGGIYARANAQLNLTASTISGNQAYHGGGISTNSEAQAFLYNTTISGNFADYSGGGLYSSDGGTLDLTFVTVTGNIADYNFDTGGTGGGFSSLEPFTMTNTIIAGNYDYSGVNPDCRGYLNSGDYNILGVADSVNCIDTLQGNDQSGTMASPLIPLLFPLANNGGPTKTHALDVFSPAVDQIPDGVNGCDLGVTRDQRGVIRFGGCDIGAFEIDVGHYVYLPLVLR